MEKKIFVTNFPQNLDDAIIFRFRIIRNKYAIKIMLQHIIVRVYVKLMIF